LAAAIWADRNEEDRAPQSGGRIGLNGALGAPPAAVLIKAS
jgi:hypothetical protein